MFTWLSGLGLADWKDVASIFAVGLTFLALIKGGIEYVLQGSQKRAELFMSMQQRLKEITELNTISEMLELRSPSLRSMPFKDKSVFLCFFEEVALMMKSNLIKKDVAHYMFGYYAIRCWDSDDSGRA